MSAFDPLQTLRATGTSNQMKIGLKHFVVASAGLSLSIGSAAPASVRPKGTCIQKDIPVEIQERASSDTYRALQLSGGDTITVFKTSPRLDVLRGRQIADEEPTEAVARLTDGSGMSFNRDCRGTRCVYLGLRVGSHAEACWEWMSPANGARHRDSAGAFVLSSNKSIALQNSRRGGRLVLRTLENGGRVKAEPLIITSRPIVGFGVSVQSIEGNLRTVDVIKVERDGSLSLATYAYAER